MAVKLVLKKQQVDGKQIRRTHPGYSSYDLLIESDTDLYSESGLELLYRKDIVSWETNDGFPILADFCEEKISNRTDASGHQSFEVSRIAGYDLNYQSNDYVTETQFTRTRHKEYKESIVTVAEEVNGIFKEMFTVTIYPSKNLEIDPHFFDWRDGFYSVYFKFVISYLLSSGQGQRQRDNE